MDERKSNIAELAAKNRSDSEARIRLLEGVGENLLRKIGEDEPFPEKSGNTPGGVLAEYHRLQKEIAESVGIIRSLEEDAGKLKEVEGKISAAEGEKAGLEKDLLDAYALLGETLLGTPGLDGLTEASIRQEEILFAKIDDLEKKLKELEEKRGGVFSRLKNNAQIAMSKTLLAKHRSVLQRFYRTEGEKFLDAKLEIVPEGDLALCVDRAGGLKDRLSGLTADIAELKENRRKIIESFGSDGSPAKRIQGLEKHIDHVKGDCDSVYLRFGLLATESGGKEAVSAYLSEEDVLVLQRAEIFKTQIADREQNIKRLETSINIDGEKAEIEKMKKAIQNQQDKIAVAKKSIADLEKKIAETELHIEELKSVLR